MGKYGNENVEYEGMSFDSKRELKRWKELVLLQKDGKILYICSALDLIQLIHRINAI